MVFSRRFSGRHFFHTVSSRLGIEGLTLIAVVLHCSADVHIVSDVRIVHLYKTFVLYFR